MNRMVIVLEGGLIQAILANTSIEVLVKDYDTDGDDEYILDEDGHRYYSSRYKIVGEEALEQIDRIDEIFKRDDEHVAPGRSVVIEETVVSKVHIPDTVLDSNIKAYLLGNTVKREQFAAFLRVVKSKA